MWICHFQLLVLCFQSWSGIMNGISQYTTPISCFFCRSPGIALAISRQKDLLQKNKPHQIKTYFTCRMITFRLLKSFWFSSTFYISFFYLSFNHLSLVHYLKPPEYVWMYIYTHIHLATCFHVHYVYGNKNVFFSLCSIFEKNKALVARQLIVSSVLANLPFLIQHRSNFESWAIKKSSLIVFKTHYIHHILLSSLEWYNIIHYEF